STLKTDIQCLNGLKYADDGGTIHLNCFILSVNLETTAWFKQTPGEKPLLIASTFHTTEVKYNKDFERSGRFNAVTDKSSFNLTISNAEPSDSATYYCAMADYTNIALSACTVLVLKDSPSRLYTVLQHPVSDPVELGGEGDTKLCSVHYSQIRLQENTSCVYKLPKRNLSLSDAGTYYCAVAACGQILFGNGTKLDFVGTKEYDSKNNRHWLWTAWTYNRRCVRDQLNMAMRKSKEMYSVLVTDMGQEAGGPSKIDLPCVDGVKFIQNGEDVTLNCPFRTLNAITSAWYKQTPGEKLLLIASAFQSMPFKYHNGFEKSGRFTALGEQSTFTLNISNAEPSDSATYYCAVAYFSNATLLECTVLVLKDSSSRLYTVLQHPVSDPVKLGGDTTLQCSVLTDTSAGEHSVYWFRHGSEESHPGIIYTHGNRSDQCKSSSETDSSTQSCVYKLPKRILSLSDAGTYYCAVLMCGEIILGNRTKLDVAGNRVLDPAILGLAASNVIFIVVVLLLCRKLHCCHHTELFLLNHVLLGQAEDTNALNYAALSFAQSSSSKRSRTKNSSDQPVYSQVHIRQ
ncbi:hypothetical protein NFI96_028068, partial [Prochilodus magdalenae]